MTTIVYNGVALRDCETKLFEQDVQYDESNTDVMYSRFRIRVASHLVSYQGATNNSLGKTQFGIDSFEGLYSKTTAAQRHHDIQARLSEARGDFWMLIDNMITQQDGGGAPETLDQPLLIAAGKAYDEEIVTASIGGAGGTFYSDVSNTPLYMPVHPFSGNADTPEYGSGTIAKWKVLDCENGPKPKHVAITQVFGGRGFRVEFEIEVCRKLCKDDFQDEAPVVFGGDINSSNYVLSNRWYLDESKDDDWFTTRTLQGTLRVAHASYWPHAMRLLCLPKLLKGYKRVRQSFVSDPTDTILKYRIEDRQAHAAPPYPAVKWSGHHAETASGPGGQLRHSEIHIRLHGPPGCNKMELIAAAGKVAVHRINGLAFERDANGRIIDASTVLENASIVDVLDQPIIEVRAQVKRNDQNQFRALGIGITEMGKGMDGLAGDSSVLPYKVDGYDPRVWPVPLAYDSDTPAGVFNCYLQHPCSVWHDLPGGLAPNDTGEPTPVRPGSGESGLPDAKEYPVDQEIPYDTTDRNDSSDLLAFPYTFIELSNRYETDAGWMATPLASVDPAAQRTASLIRLHGSVTRRILTLVATRNAKWPTIPTMQEQLTDPNGIREVLQRTEITSKAPELTASGSGRMVSVEVKYTYLMERAPRLNEKLRVGSTPLDLFSPDSNWIDLSLTQDQAGHYQYESGTTVTYPPASSS